MSNITDEKIVRWRELTQREHNAGVLVSVDAVTLNALIDEVERLRADRLAVAERAANLLISDIHETLTGMVSGWRDTAHDYYCKTYNKGMGEGLEDCAKHLEAYLNGMYQRDRTAIARRAVDAEGGG